MAIDIGMLYSRNHNIIKKYILNFNFGVSLLNSSNGIEYDYYGSRYFDGLPNIVRMGYAVTFNLPKRKFKLNPFSITHNLEYAEIINYDKTTQTKGYKFLGYGLEVILYEMFLFRIGNRSLKSKKYYADILDMGFSYGFGLEIPIDFLYNSFPLSVSYNYAHFPWNKEHYLKIHSLNIKYKF